MADVGRCNWSPTGWARLNETGGCTCDPCDESGVRIKPRDKFRWERRIRRILRKNGVHDPYTDMEYGLLEAPDAKD